MNKEPLPINDLDLVILLGDPRFNNPYHGSEAQKEHEQGDVSRLKEAMSKVVDNKRITYLDNHQRLLDDLRRYNPDLVLNFCNDGYRNRPELHMHMAALLDVFGLSFAGADANCLAKCHDKASINAAAARLQIPVPRMELLRLGTGDVPEHYPCVLKPNNGSGSMGITSGSVVTIEKQASKRLAELAHESQGRGWVVAEEFLDGREFSVAVLGSTESGEPPTCLPALEIDFSKLPEDRPRIMTHNSKANQESVDWQQVAMVPAELSEDVRKTVEAACLRMFERFDCRDYARFDFRTDDNGIPCLIDVNAHPEWGCEGMMAQMAGFAGLGYEDLLARIIRSAQTRTSANPPPEQRPETSASVVHACGIRLRPTRPEDIDFVRDVESAPENRVLIEQWSASEHLTALQAEHSKHLIIEDENEEPAGYVILEGLHRLDRAAYLRRIVVARKGQRIGDRAMEATERYCFEELGFPSLKLEVHDDNERALGLYQRHGFQEEGRYSMVQMIMHGRQAQASTSRQNSYAS